MIHFRLILSGLVLLIPGIAWAEALPNPFMPQVLIDYQKGEEQIKLDSIPTNGDEPVEHKDPKTGYPLTSYRVVGTIMVDDEKRAVIASPAGGFFTLSLSDSFSELSAEIIEIEVDTITLQVDSETVIVEVGGL